MIFVRTGPPAGNNSLYACAWNWVTDSAMIGCVTPDAPWKGCVRSWYWIPNRSSPLVYPSSHSDLDSWSISYCSRSSDESSPRAESSKASAKFASCSYSPVSTSMPCRSARASIKAEPSGFCVIWAPPEKSSGCETSTSMPGTAWSAESTIAVISFGGTDISNTLYFLVHTFLRPRHR